MLGKDHRETVETMTSLARAYRKQRRYADSIQMQQEVFANSHQTIGYENSDRLVCMNDPNLISLRLLGGDAITNVFSVCDSNSPD
jgi:hypothetical protein